MSLWSRFWEGLGLAGAVGRGGEGAGARRGGLGPSPPEFSYEKWGFWGYRGVYRSSKPGDHAGSGTQLGSRGLAGGHFPRGRRGGVLLKFPLLGKSADFGGR